ncbi:MAG: HAD-IIIC family phosphatase [Candidatus Omnitrophota bacterium]|nr:HAD-IIIC family phosphatase [Candidatus Omnitrophota bacterium]
MFEFEIQSKELQASDVPPAVLSSFTCEEPFERSILAWGEHCIECAIPQCYKTCDLYEARSDLKCRRFIDGIVKIRMPASYQGYITRITFKTWGELWSFGNARVYSRAGAVEAVYRFFARVAKLFPSVLGLGYWNVPRLFSSFCKGVVDAMRALPIGREAEYFLIQIYNEESRVVTYSLKITNEPEGGKIPFMKLFEIDPGYHEVLVHVSEISERVDLKSRFSIYLVPNIEDGPVTAYFSLVHFVRYARGRQHPCSAKNVKCVVWDLDDVLWEGILAESDISSLKLRDGMRDILRTLDERGVLQSIASKNHPDLAMEALRHLGIDHYFLYPQIHWHPKSRSLKTLQEQLGLGMEAFALLDDSPFERAEVKQNCPGALTIDAVNCQNLLAYPCFGGSRDEDSRQRRYYYQVEAKRKEELESKFKDEYSTFLRGSKITLTLSHPDSENADRIHDLIQRTNQMNFSPNRYSREEVARIIKNPDLEKWVLSAADRFGDYGIIGFSVIDKKAAHITDLLFSCRVQMKRIEHAFLSHVLDKYRKAGAKHFKVTFYETKRNSHNAKVFDDLGFERVAAGDGVDSFQFLFDRGIPREDIVSVLER